MKIIVGLGNPGKEYESTRHNAGFLCVDFLREKWDFSSWKEEKKFKAYISEGMQNNEKVILCKPQTYMNLSGEAVAMTQNYYKCDVSDIMVIYDDKDLLFGTTKIRPEGGTAGHKGIKSIVNALGTESIVRIRIGVECRDEDSHIDTKDFILSRFTKSEEEKLQEIFEKIEHAIHLERKEGIKKAMEYLNG